MILSTAVFFGFGAGLLRARRAGRRFQPLPLRWPGLIFFAFAIQALIFNRTGLPIHLSDTWASLGLCASQAMLVWFAWLNRQHAGLRLMALGLLLNFLVICLNGGWMPISPDTVRAIYPGAPAESWQIGQRLGSGKDIVLQTEDTHLVFLSDCFVLPASTGYPMAFSLGDVLLACGAGWLLWSLGGNAKNRSINNEHTRFNGINTRIKPRSEPAAVRGSYQPALPPAAVIEPG